MVNLTLHTPIIIIMIIVILLWYKNFHYCTDLLSTLYSIISNWWAPYESVIWLCETKIIGLHNKDYIKMITWFHIRNTFTYSEYIYIQWKHLISLKKTVKIFLMELKQVKIITKQNTYQFIRIITIVKFYNFVFLHSNFTL